MKTVQIDLKGKQNKVKTLPHPELSVFQYISDTPTMLIPLLFFFILKTFSCFHNFDQYYLHHYQYHPNNVF